MEVHHHPEVGKKNFKEYLLEGLMIFLAVTMGFFAEGLRENISKNEKEKSYIVSLVNNLKDDTANMNRTIFTNRQKIKGLDSLLLLSSSDLTEPSDRRKLYRYSGNYVSWTTTFSSNDATMMQLKNSGGLQYIRRSHIADSIAAYDQVVRDIYGSATPYTNSINDAVNAMEELLVFSPGRDSSINKDNAQATRQYPLLTSDPLRRNIFFNKIYIEQGWTENLEKDLVESLSFTTRLIIMLKKEYDLD